MPIFANGKIKGTKLSFNLINASSLNLRRSSKGDLDREELGHPHVD